MQVWHLIALALAYGGCATTLVGVAEKLGCIERPPHFVILVFELGMVCSGQTLAAATINSFPFPLYWANIPNGQDRNQLIKRTLTVRKDELLLNATKY